MKDDQLALSPVLKAEERKPATTMKRNGARRGRGLRQLATAFPFLAPNLIGFFLFTFFPVLASIALSVTKWDLLTPPEFVGLENYANLIGFSFDQGRLQFNDPDFWKYVWNTIFLMGAIPLAMAGSLFLAILLNGKFPGRSILRSIYFLPSMCVPVAVYMLWRWLLNPGTGLLNWVLSYVGIEGPDWLGSTTWSKPALMLAGLWASVGGYNMILYLAGLQGIPGELYEAAKLDGAAPWHRFRYITWPLLAPTTFFITVTSIIAGLQGGFDAAYIMTNGGPAGSTTTIMFYIYNSAFQWMKMGYAAAMAWVLFTMVFAITLLNWRVGGRHAQFF